MTTGGKPKPFKFGVNMIVPESRAAWVGKCRKAEDLGFDVVGAADHLGMAPPFPALVLAAEVTERVRLNTFVINTAFYNPVLLARDVTGTDQFTEGRLELGLGAGYVKSEFEAAGLEFPRAGRRVDHLEHTIKELKRLYADEAHKPETVQKPGPPLMIAGRGDRLLGLAAEHADIIGFTGTKAVPDGGALAPDDADGIAERVDFVRGKLNGRDVELNLLPHFVAVVEDRQKGLENLRELVKGQLSVDQLAVLPTALVGTHEQIAEQFLAHRERYGFSYFTVLEHNMEALAPVIELLRAP
ncbi:LLM class F420-dependent oxidoreductase [Amycolatopsis orientalis]|uniref:LLM class F420-dependent oxidoreductase n=1 Tax=Amycolatopsis orientalis TaxID=31958 RepID=UPI00041A39B9|nr:LLM class F420-dependent oxidoreductase [Amycolatopsis orientalis]